MIRPFDVLLVDEPFVGLDASGKEAMLTLLADMHSDGATVIVATHQLEYIEQATRVIALRDGAITYDGAPDSTTVRELVQA
jgi:ABC-type multidrug transport system ATPase subunit